VADLDGSVSILAKHIAEAIQYSRGRHHGAAGENGFEE